VSTGAVDGLWIPWTVSVVFEGDTLSGIVQMFRTSLVNGTLSGPTAITALTGVSFYPGQTGLPASGGVQGPGFVPEFAFGLAVGVQFGLSNVLNSANLYQMQLFAE
jgi:hypothetical protein